MIRKYSKGNPSMNYAAVLHNSTRDFVYSDGTSNQMTFKIRTEKDDCILINLYFRDKSGHRIKSEQLYNRPMEKIASDELFDYYETTAELNSTVTKYYFELISCNKDLTYYSLYKFYDEAPTDYSLMFDVPLYARKEDAIKPVAWMQNGIMYQIFPDRFYNSPDSACDKQISEYMEKAEWDSKPRFNSIYGGNIKGIYEKLDYLKELGVTIIYLTPIFKSISNHKYDTIDYYVLDPSFGTDDEFRQLVDGIHERDMHIILDGVFNHCGFFFAPFQDLIMKGKDSEYYDWFIVNDPDKPVYKGTDFSSLKDNFPPNYYAFSYIPVMPKLNTQNIQVREYIFGVIDHWMRDFGVDGWRLDVADEVSHEFWTEFKRRVRANKPDAPVIGEIWYDSRDWLLGNEFDSVMNYQFSIAVNKWIGSKSISVTDFINSYGFVRGSLNRYAFSMLLNLIDSHDVKRFLTVCNGSKDRLKLAVILMMSFAGTPMIYYGDEVGMEGGDDPDCRRGMYWDDKKVDKELLDFYKNIITLRKNEPALRSDRLKVVLADNDRDLLIFTKYPDKNSSAKALRVIINNSPDPAGADEIKSAKDLITGDVFDKEIPSYTGIIYYI